MSTTQRYAGKFISPDQFFEDQEVLKTVFNGYAKAEREMFFSWLWRTGRKKEHTKRDEFHHWEHDTLFRVATVASKTGTAGAGNNVTVVLSAADHENGGKTSGFPIKTLVRIYTSTGEIGGRVVDKDTTTDGAHSLTIQPADSTVDLVTATAAADKIIDVSTAKGDGTSWTESLVRNKVRKSGRIQIFDRKSSLDLGEASNMQKVEVKTPNGGKSLHYYNQKDVDLMIELQKRMGNQFMFGDYSEDYVDEDNGNPVFVSKSLDHYVRTEGFTQAYTTAPDLADFDAILDYLEVEGAPSEQIIMPGGQLSRKLDELFKGQFDNGAIDFGNWGLGSESGKKVDFNFDGFKYGAFDFAKMKNVEEFHYKGMNYNGNKWRGTGFIIPADTMNDATTGEEIPRLCVRYRKSPIENRFMKRILRNPEHTNADTREIILQGEAGLQGIGMNQTVKLESA